MEQRLDDLDIVCETRLSLTGSFVEGAAQPAELNGCWPVGTWEIQAVIDFEGCDPQVPMTTHRYQVNRVDDSNRVTFSDDPDDERVNLKITSAGDGLCHGNFEHFGLDRRVISLQPTLEANGTLTGTGAYAVYSYDPF